MRRGWWKELKKRQQVRGKLAGAPCRRCQQLGQELLSTASLDITHLPSVAPSQGEAFISKRQTGSLAILPL